MEKENIRSIMQDALEEEMPSSQINLWPAIKADLVAGKNQFTQQGTEMNATLTKRNSRLAFVVLILLVLLVAAFATPQGRSFAQSVLQFFTRAENTSFPVESSQLAEEESEQLQPTAQPPSPLMSVAEAEARAGFKAAVLNTTPAGFKFNGARLYGDNVVLEYEPLAGNGHLMIAQSEKGFNESEWDMVPASEIIPVKVGDSDGEYTQGTFVVYAGDTSATWKPDMAIRRLRWAENGIWFQMTKYGDAAGTEYLDQEGLVELAASLTFAP